MSTRAEVTALGSQMPSIAGSLPFSCLPTQLMVHRTPVQEAEVAASVHELLSIQVRRHKLEQWVNEPFFEETLRGCVVRAALHGRYHMALVVDVKEQTGTHR